MGQQRSRWLTAFLVAAAIILVIPAVELHGQSATDAEPAGLSAPAKVHPALAKLVADGDEPVKAWVFFTDKGIRSPEAYEAAVQRVASTYDERAKQRRLLRGDNAARGRPVFDEHDLPVVEAYVEAIAATGARVHVTSRWLNAVSAYADRAQLERIAALPFVTKLQPVARSARIDPPQPDDDAAASGEIESTPAGPRSIDYGQSQSQLAQMNLIALHDAGFTGDGVVVGILDTGFTLTHEAYNNPLHPLQVIAAYDFINNDSNVGIQPGDPSSQHDHGTKTLSCLGAYAPGEMVGGAYDASFILAKTEDTAAEYPAEEDNYVAGLEFIEANGADMATASLGYIDWYTQADLDGLTAVTTIAINILTSHGVHHCNAAGNEYHDSNPSTSSLIAPADGFDVITCGAVDSAGTIASFSSDGPTADGRIKPEVLARGVSASVVSSSSNTGYTTASGTSFSTPLTACTVACLVQANPYWTVAEMRAHLFETASDYVANGTHDPLFVRGYGIVNAFAAWADCNLNDIADGCDVDCGASGGPCDVPGCGGSADCNGNAVPDECESDCNGNGVPDDCDIAACLPGDSLCADCNGNDIPDECEVPFPQQGRIALDRGAYSCGASIMILVSDCGLNLDGGAVETVPIVIESDSEPGGEAVILTESEPNSSAFEGSIPLDVVDSGGVLLVNDGDEVTATYVDADDGLGGTDIAVVSTAAVDCQAPAISNVQAVEVGAFEARITANLNEPAGAVVRYGTSCGALVGQASGLDLANAVDVTLAGLSQETTYYFAVDVEDEAGNAATDDNNGLCHAFTTESHPDYFTEAFVSGTDLEGLSILFTPDGSFDFYQACTEPMANLPTDPAGGNVLSLGDDDTAQVTLAGGATVSLYGIVYSSFYVSSNGYLTFGSGDSDYDETLEEHFAPLPRISGWYDDLNPSSDGEVSWRQLPDRATATWSGVPEYNGTENNTFQVELYFDGRIRLSYVAISANDGIVGLSDGGGLPVDFIQTDLSGYGGCRAAPPLPAPVPHDVRKNRYISFTPNSGDHAVAFRVELVESAYFPSWSGVVGWVSKPDSLGTAEISPTRVNDVWTQPVVHAGDCPIVPVATYVVRAIAADASESDPSAFSDPLSISTIDRPGTEYWADSVGAFVQVCSGDGVTPCTSAADCPPGGTCGVWPGPDGYINFDDIGGAVKTFQRVPGTVWPHLTRVDLHGDDAGDPAVDPPNRVANFADIQHMVFAFQGSPYPFSAPANCPGVLP